jgi:hypothetical protein
MEEDIMAEYGRIGSASDYMRQERVVQAKASRVQKKVSKTTVFDFGKGPYTVEDILDFAKQIVELPPGAKLGIQHGDSQLDGEWLKITVIEA